MGSDGSAAGGGVKRPERVAGVGKTQACCVRRSGCRGPQQDIRPYSLNGAKNWNLEGKEKTPWEHSQGVLLWNYRNFLRKMTAAAIARPETVSRLNHSTRFMLSPVTGVWGTV